LFQPRPPEQVVGPGKKLLGLPQGLGQLPDAGFRLLHYLV
jgi:hypothetical protein